MTDHNTGRILDRLLVEADKLYQMGRVQQAADTLVQSIEQFPGDKRSYHAFSAMLIDGNQFEDGLGFLQKIPDTGRDPRTLELTGYCLMGLGRLDEAGEHARKILSDNCESAPGLNLLGRLAYQQGDMAAAEDYFDQAIKSEPDYGPAWVNLGMIQWERGQNQAALDWIEKGFIHNPTDMTAFTAYHAAVTELGVFERSESVFKTAVKHSPHNERLQYLLIDVLVKQHKYPAALDEIQKALAVFGAGEELIAAAEKVQALAGPVQTANKDRNECRLSVCVIVKNEAAHLAKCLQSVKPVADEIIVVDTGSTDHSRDIAGLFGAGVSDYQWADNFAKARNFAISRACGKWILCLDADEVISPLDYAALRNLVEKRSGRPTAYSIVTRNYINRVNALGWTPNDGQYVDEEAGYGWFPSEKVRLFPNQDNLRFEFPVHEMVEPALSRLGIDILSCQIPVHHYGKLDEQNSAAKGQQYYRIGIQKLAEMEHSVAAIRELAIQAANLEKYEEAVSLWQKVIGLRPDMADAFVNLGTAYWNLGKYHEAVESAKKAMKLAPNMKEAHFNLALSLLHHGQAGAAISVLENLLDKFPAYLSARFLMAAVHCCTGQPQKGAQAFNTLKPSKLGPGLAISCHTLAQGLLSAGQVKYAQAILNAARCIDPADEDVPALLKVCRDTV